MIYIASGALVPAKAAIIRQWINGVGSKEFEQFVANTAAFHAANAANYLCGESIDGQNMATEEASRAKFFTDMLKFIAVVKAPDYQFPTVQLLPEQV